MKQLQPQKLKFNTSLPHKGQNGRVLVVGGNGQYSGAVYLAAMSALRSGVDKVTVLCPSSVAMVLKPMAPDLLVAGFGRDAYGLTSAQHLGLLSYYSIKVKSRFEDVLLIGNGLGEKYWTQMMARKVAKLPVLKVIDADALKAISIKDAKNAILTPHLKEFQILVENTTGETLELGDPICMAKKGQSLLTRFGENVAIVLKGPADYIITQNTILENKTGNARMRVAGTGDVLAGTIAGILAQTKDFMKAISIAIPAVIETADKLYEARGGSYTASDVLEGLHKVIFK